jgi:glutamate/aspartate transport system substrate-binding protein
MFLSAFFRTIFCLILLMIGGANCFAGATLDRIKINGVVNIGFRDDQLPFSYKEAGYDRPLGYSIDICNVLADAIKKEVGVKSLGIKYLQVTGATRFPQVAEGKVDFECGCTTNTKERREKVAFSMPIYFSSAKLLVRKDSGITSIADLAGKTLALEKGSTGLKIAESRKSRMNTMKILFVDSSAAGVVAVEKKTADAFINDDALLYAVKAQSKESLAVTWEGMSVEPIAIIFSKDDHELATLVEREMAKLVLSGQLRALYKKWFQSPLPQKSFSLNMAPNQLTADILVQPSSYTTDWATF